MTCASSQAEQMEKSRGPLRFLPELACLLLNGLCSGLGMQNYIFTFQIDEFWHAHKHTQLFHRVSASLIGDSLTGFTISVL